MLSEPSATRALDWKKHMRTVECHGPWAVYLRTMDRQVEPRHAVCSQDEWDTMERARPGYHRLVRGGIASEREAELLARGTSGDSRTARSSKKQSRLESLAQPLR